MPDKSEKISSAFSAVLIHRWVQWWVFVGVVCGIVALVNVLFRDLTREQERLIIVVGIIFWLLGGLVCWASGGIRIEVRRTPQDQPAVSDVIRTEWHEASEFVLPGGGHTLLPPSRARRHRDRLADYFLEATGGNQSAK